MAGFRSGFDKSAAEKAVPADQKDLHHTPVLRTWQSFDAEALNSARMKRGKP